MKSIRLILAITIIGGLAVTGLAQSFITNGLVAYYPFNGDATDASGHGNDGVINGGVALAPDRFGSDNSAYTFNGEDGYIDIGNPVGNSPDYFSATAWVKILSRENGGTVIEDVIITKRQTRYIGSGWPDLVVESSGPNEGVGEIIIDADNYAAQYYGTTHTPTNVWFFVCEVKSNSVYQIYVNGALETTATNNLSLSSVENMYLMHHAEWGTYCNGLLDDVRLYNRALSSNEVSQIFAIEGGGAPTITAQPTNVTVNIGGTAYFSVTATSANQLSYQWFREGVSLLNATNAMLIFTNIQPPQIGNYSAVITSFGGSITSSVVTLDILGVNPVLWRGLAAYYPFNGNASDASGSGNDGAIYGGVALAPDRFGSNNSAFTFNGVDGYIDVGNPSGNSPAYLSETAWVNILSRETSGTVPEDVIITKRHTGNIGSGWPDLAVKSSGPSAGAGELIIDADGYLAQYTGTTRIPTNVWFFICTVKSNSVYQIYVNGGLESTVTNTRALSSVENMYLMHHGQWNTFCNGMLDDVRIYKRALASGDVALIYASEAPPAPPHTATGTATLAGGFVVGVNITGVGGGYTNTPLVRFIGGGGSGAQAFAVVSNGVVIAINIINAGSGYSNAPVVVIDPPYIPNPVLSIAPVSILAFSALTVNSNYQLQLFQAPIWTNQSASFKATNANYTQVVAGLVSSGDYRLVRTPFPTQASAIPQLINGFVVGATVTAGGSGYITPPAVTIIANVGSNATATASVSGGKVTTINIISAGSGYVNPVTIQIDPPPVTALSPAITPGVGINSSGLAPYYNYQLQFKSNLFGAWGNWSSTPFIPSAETNYQNILTTNSAGFFRVQLLP